MEPIIAITSFCLILVVIASLFTYVLITKRNKAFRLYQSASMAESRGNYEEAIILFENYLRAKNISAEEKYNIQQRIKTLQSLTATVIAMHA